MEIETIAGETPALRKTGRSADSPYRVLLIGIDARNYG